MGCASVGVFVKTQSCKGREDSPNCSWINGGLPVYIIIDKAPAKYWIWVWLVSQSEPQGMATFKVNIAGCKNYSGKLFNSLQQSVLTSWSGGMSSPCQPSLGSGTFLLLGAWLYHGLHHGLCHGKLTGRHIGAKWYEDDKFIPVVPVNFDLKTYSLPLTEHLLGWCNTPCPIL